MARQLPPRAAENDIKQVGIWIRVSTEDQAKGESPEHHERRARSYADAKGWNVREVYNLAGVSGKAVMHHPEAMRMIQDLKNGHIKGLIFSKLARLARNTRELLDFADIFRDQGADLISLQESIDTSTPAGRLFYTMIAAMAQWEREEIAERITVSIPIRAKLGKPLGGFAPYGYQWKDRKLIPHPVEGPTRKLVYELFVEHHRLKSVARLLNEAGHRTRRSKKFTDTDIRRFITDSSAKGIYRANYTCHENGKQMLKPEKDWIFTPVEPLVSEELWNRCNTLIDDRKRGPRPISKKPVHLFAGVAHCICGSKMYVPSNTPKYVCQACRNKIPIVDLEAVFHEQLKNFFLSPDEIAKYLNEADKTLHHKEEVLDILIKEKQRIVQSMDKVYQLYIDGQITAEGFGSRYKPLEERSKQLDEEIPRLQAEIDLLKISYLSKDQIFTNARDLYNRWPSLAYDEKRKITESLTQRITIGKGEIDIDLCYLPSPTTQSPLSPSSENVAKGQHTVGAKKKIVVAMSGGVDSAVAAALLKQEGHECIGVFMRLGNDPGDLRDSDVEEIACSPQKRAEHEEEASRKKQEGKKGKEHHQGCCSSSDAADARYVAGLLDIPFYALNFQHDFGGIIDYFVREYNRGRTPNPCVRCNEYLKFGKLSRYAKAIGADFVATGHYARVGMVDGEAALLRGRDRSKDQSYVLFGVPPAELGRMILPIGEMEKTDVRGMARELGLPVFDKPDSQEICFVPDNDYAGLVKKRSPDAVRPGELVNVAGEVVGEHRGHQHFTIGQRKGVGVAFGYPIYVTGIDAATNRVKLGAKEELLQRSLVAREVNWLMAGGREKAERGIRCRAKVRYNSQPASATAVMVGPDELRVTFDDPVLAITAGQAVVCYSEDGERVLGGGWIDEVGP